MTHLQGKKGIILGIANERSIATAIAKDLHARGCELGVSYLPDEKGRSLQRVQKALAGGTTPKFVEPCNVDRDADLQSFFQRVKQEFGQIDFMVHSIAFAPVEDIRCPTVSCSRSGFLKAMESSVYSFMACSRYAAELMPQGGSLVTLSYYGGEKVVPGYNMMGVVKAALESSVRYLAYELGGQKIRVNALSAGPLKTLAASAIGDFSEILNLIPEVAPLRQNITHDDVAKSAAYLLSSLSSGVTGTTLHVDSGYHAMASSPAKA